MLVRTALALALATVAAFAAPPALSDPELDSLVDFYVALHKAPELSFYEEKTAAKLVGELRGLGFEVTEKVGGHGFVALLRNGEGPTVMLRTDLDGLPVVEATGRPYASDVRTTDDQGNNVGVMHACGHDIHMSSFIGAARKLAGSKSEWKGTLMMIGQPAEERGAGARAMLDDGLFERFPRRTPPWRCTSTRASRPGPSDTPTASRWLRWIRWTSPSEASADTAPGRT